MSPGVLLFVIGAALLQPAAPANGQSLRAPDCTDWRACRQMVETALETGEVELAQDLAWRAVQRGPKDDPDLMFLLARAQSRSSRPHDALVMVRRLAERGVRTAAGTHPDLERMRALDAWPETEAIVARVDAGQPVMPAGSPSAAAGALPRERTAEPAATSRVGAATFTGRGNPGAGTAPDVPARASGVTASAATPFGANEPLRFSAERFVAAGLAYDAVSHRFVYGDRDGRKLRVVGVGLDHAIDLVRAESAGFFHVRALDIDTRRGDLWVVSGSVDGGAAALHRLQLVSGRPLAAVPLVGDLLPLWPVDLTVTDGGTVLVLDRGGRLVRLRSGRSTPEALMLLNLEGATSLTARGEGVVFVAAPHGVSRVDLASKTVTALGASKDVSLAGFERLRLYRGGLVGLQADADGARRGVRLELTANGRRVRQATPYDPRFDAAAGPIALAVSGDEVSLITGGPDPSGPVADTSAAGTPAELTVHRLRLR